jgi:aminopeptidase
MSDPRLAKLADVLISHSTRLAPGQKVLIETFDTPDAFVNALIERASAMGAIPFVETRQTSVLRSLYRNASEGQMRQIGELELARMQQMDAYIGVRGAQNSLEMSDVPSEKMALYQKHWWKTVSDWRINKTKWVVLRYPTPAFAQAANMSTEQFEEFYFNVCTLDYSKMAAAQQPLYQRMLVTDRVRLTGKNTELSFSIKNIGAQICAGECFSCPVRDSVNGEIQFNVPASYQSTAFDNVCLAFKDGKIIKATAGDKTERLNAILDTDEGARYIGEFSLGFNPYVLQPMRDTLFDEKIAGSFHFTPGQAYAIADNGNKSDIHWDMVFIQRPEYGGGEVWFDDELIRKDGLFVPKDLLGLNPENLK